MEIENINIERSLLSSVFYSPIIFDDIVDNLKSEHFFFKSHRDVFDCMCELFYSEKPLEHEFIIALLRQKGIFNETAFAYIISTSAISNISAYMETLRDLYTKRQIKSYYQKLRQKLIEKEEIEDILNFMENKMEAIIEEKNVNDNMKFENYGDFCKRIDLMPEIIRTRTGINFLDSQLCGGFAEDTFINLAGESGVGKTTLVLQLLKNISKKHKLFFFSLEMSEKLVRRNIGDLSEIQNKHLFIDSKSYRLSKIIKTIKFNKKYNNISFFTIDSKMKILIDIRDKTIEKQHEKISSMSSVFHRITKELHVTILLINQMTSSSNNYELKGSGDQKYDSDLVLFLTMNPQTKERIIICQNDRNVPKGRDDKWQHKYTLDDLENKHPDEIIYNMGGL